MFGKSCFLCYIFRVKQNSYFLWEIICFRKSDWHSLFFCFAFARCFAPEKERVITIALMASPVKRMPDCRGWGEDWNYRCTQRSHCFSSPPYWGGFCCWLGRYPAWHNFDIPRKLDETRKTGKIDQPFVDAWVARLLQGSSADVPWVTNAADPKGFTTSHVNAAFHQAKDILFDAPDSKMYFYTCDKDEPERLPEYPY